MNTVYILGLHRSSRILVVQDFTSPPLFDSPYFAVYACDSAVNLLIDDKCHVCVCIQNATTLHSNLYCQHLKITCKYISPTNNDLESRSLKDSYKKSGSGTTVINLPPLQTSLYVYIINSPQDFKSKSSERGLTKALIFFFNSGAFKL